MAPKFRSDRMLPVLVAIHQHQVRNRQSQFYLLNALQTITTEAILQSKHITTTTLTIRNAMITTSSMPTTNPIVVQKIMDTARVIAIRITTVDATAQPWREAVRGASHPHQIRVTDGPLALPQHPHDERAWITSHTMVIDDLAMIKSMIMAHTILHLCCRDPDDYQNRASDQIILVKRSVAAATTRYILYRNLLMQCLKTRRKSLSFKRISC